jgi:hypothetical protein
MMKFNYLPQFCMGQVLCLAFATQFAFISYAQQPTNSPIPKAEELSGMSANTPDKELFFCTTRIEAKSADGKQTSTGTGFILQHKIDEQHNVPFIVTCRHVINGFATAAVSFVQIKNGKPDLGNKCEVTIPIQRLVFYDPNPQIDLALIPFVPILSYFSSVGQTPFYRALSEDLIPSEAAADDLSAIQPVVFVGYPSGMRDETNLLPIARRGFTASPYIVDFNALPLFLVDANVFPGSSGSPVMVLDQGAFSSKGGLAMGSRAYFLGLVSSAYFQPVDGELQFKPMPSQFVPVVTEQRYLNLGGVIKAKAILNTISQFMKAHPIPINSTNTASH